MAPRPIALDTAREGWSLLDVRAAEAFRAGHLTGSGHLPAAELQPRRAELPPREQPVVALADDPEDARAAALALDAMGYRQVAWLDAPLAAIAGGHADVGPPARLWRPAPFLAEVLPMLPRGRAIDLAAGSGREAVFLALNGFEVEARDRAPEALGRAEDLARRHGARLRSVVCDLERPHPPLETRAYDVITVFRFLHRPLFRAIEAGLAPGGMLVYETYRVGQERFGRPRSRRYLLDSGELRAAFPSLEVLRYDEPGPLLGPLTARLLARKPASDTRSAAPVG
jgi:rhodanese-related sulfurtransferase